MDSSLLWVGVCALSVVCVGLLLVGAFMVFRGGFGIFKDLYASNFGEEDIVDSSLDVPVLRRRGTSKLGAPSNRLGARAQSVDPFDEALQRQRSSTSSANPPRAGLDTPRAGLDTPTSPLGRERRIPRNPSNVPPADGGRNTRRGEGQEIYDDEDGGFF